MPYFSFSLKKNFLKDANLEIENMNMISQNKIYYSKNTLLWKFLSKNKANKLLNFAKFEKRKKTKKIGKKILFLLPPSIGMGDAIEYALAIKAIDNSKKFQNIGIGFVGRFEYIFKKYFNLNTIYAEYIEENVLKDYDTIFHFSLEIFDLEFQKYKRVDIENSITNFFQIKKYRKKNILSIDKIKTISLFPISQSPIRSMSVDIINESS